MIASRKAPGPILVFGGFIVAASLALLTAWTLARLSRPVDLDARLEALSAVQTRTKRLLAGRRSRNVYPQDAVCPSTGAADLAGLRTRLLGMAAVAGLSKADAEVAAGEAEFGDPLTPIGFSLEAKGPYTATVGLLQALQRGPALASADAVDLRADDGAVVRLTLKGRFYCWTDVSR